MIPRIVRNFGVFVNSISYQGRCTECELPDLKIKTEEIRGSGNDAGREVDMGMETLSSKLTFAEYDPALMKVFGQMNSISSRVILRGALQRDAETAVPCIVELRGGFKSATMGSWKAGELANFETECSVAYYKLILGNEVIYEIDIDNYIRRVGEIDQLESIRAAIGY